GAALLELPSKRVVLDLYEEEANRHLSALWAPDSQYFAFHRHMKHDGYFNIYARKGDGFEGVDVPDLDRSAPKPRKGGEEGTHGGSENLPKRWLGPMRLLVDYRKDVEMHSKRAERTASSSYDIILALDGKGGAKVEKATKKKAP